MPSFDIVSQVSSMEIENAVNQARKEMEFVGLAWKETKDFLPQQHFLVFEKPLGR